MIKTIIPHKCKTCNGELWFTDTNRNYTYYQKKGEYWYMCGVCNDYEKLLKYIKDNPDICILSAIDEWCEKKQKMILIENEL